MTLYVGNIPYTVGENDLQNAFSNYGEVVSVKIIKDRETGRSKGFAFVEMGSDQDGMEALNNLNGSELKGRKIRVNEANNRD